MFLTVKDATALYQKFLTMEEVKRLSKECGVELELVATSFLEVGGYNNQTSIFQVVDGVTLKLFPEDNQLVYTLLSDGGLSPLAPLTDEVLKQFPLTEVGALFVESCSPSEEASLDENS